MRIRKKYQVIPTNAKLESGHSTSDKNGYVAEYINNHSVVVSSTEPTTDRKKVWKQHSGNLFDKTKINSTYGYLNEQGEITANNSWRVSDYIYVYKIEKLFINGNTGSGEAICFYDQNKTLVSRIDTTTNLSMTLEVPSTAYYMRSTIKATNLDVYSITMQDKEYILNDNDIYEEFAPQNEVYSTNEVRIGTWIDGKPIYRKVFTFTTPSDGTATNVANITDLHIDNLINDFFSIKYVGNITTSSNNSNAIMFIRLNYGGSNDFLVMSILNSSYYSKDAFAIIEYTKTTDV